MVLLLFHDQCAEGDSARHEKDGCLESISKMQTGGAGMYTLKEGWRASRSVIGERGILGPTQNDLPHRSDF